MSNEFVFHLFGGLLGTLLFRPLSVKGLVAPVVVVIVTRSNLFVSHSLYFLSDSLEV